jgi:flagellar biosynthesis GTPase FlhF
MAASKRDNGKAKSKAGETEENNENGEEENEDEINKKKAEEEKKKADEEAKKAEEEKKKKASDERTTEEKEKFLEMEEELEALRAHNEKLQQYVDMKRKEKTERIQKEKEASSKYVEYLKGETSTAGIGIVKIKTENTAKYKDALGMVASVPLFKGRSGESFLRFKMKFDFALVGEELLEIDFIHLLVSKLTEVALDFYNEMTCKFPGSAEGLVQVTSWFINTEMQSNVLEELDVLQMGLSSRRVPPTF